MPKVLPNPIEQEKAASSAFHMRMLEELIAHHDEKSLDWSITSPKQMLREAMDRTDYASLNTDLRYRDLAAKQIVHAANYLMIAWAILTSREGTDEPTT